MSLITQLVKISMLELKIIFNINFQKYRMINPCLDFGPYITKNEQSYYISQKILSCFPI